ncbi:MAG: hypothetical protein JWM02_425 [Frankiales bacterium]|nr:hypothetical protein [Frankiales bacterium]
MSTRLAALFVAALLGLLVVFGLALAPLGWAAETPYLLVVAVGLGALVRQARALKAPEPAGRTCSCCTSTVYDPVEVR